MTDAPVKTLDLKNVGYCLIEAVAKSAMLGHGTPGKTMSPYAVHDEVMSPEYQFVRDALTMSTEELAEKWWGGQFEARLHAQTTIQAALYPEDKPSRATLADLVADAISGVSSTITHEGKPVVRVVPYEETD